MNHEEYIHKIKRDLAPAHVGSNCISEFAVKIFHYFKSNNPDHHQHLTFRSFRDVLHSKNEDNPYLASALTYLCNGVPLLEMKLEFFDEELDEFFEISHSEIREANEYGSLIHPNTGEQVIDFKRKVFVYYEPKDLAKRLYTDASS